MSRAKDRSSRLRPSVAGVSCRAVSRPSRKKNRTSINRSSKNSPWVTRSSVSPSASVATALGGAASGKAWRTLLTLAPRGRPRHNSWAAARLVKAKAKAKAMSAQAAPRRSVLRRSARPAPVISVSAVGLVATCISLLAPAAKGETLADAIALAYQSNPTLQAARAQLRATDESYVQARAGFGPTIELQAEPSYQRAQQTNIFGQSSDQESNSGAAALEVSQPLFTSGAVTWSVDAASEQIRAARQGLRTTEAQVLLGVVQAYVDVRRDQRIVAIYEGEVGILQNQLDDIRARQKAGDVTRTDVEQSQTQLDSARAALTLAEGQLQISRAEYVAVVGQNPGTLAPEPPLPGLPQTIDEAFQAVEANNGSLLQAEATEQSDAAKIEEARAQYRPSVQLSASYGYSGPLAPFAVKSEQRGISAGALVTIPLFTAGIAESNVRKAIETEAADR